MLVKLGLNEQATPPGERSQCRTNRICIYNMMLIPKKKANFTLRHIGRNVVCESGGVIILLYCYCVQFGALHSKKKDVGILESSQRGSNENDKRFRKLEL